MPLKKKNTAILLALIFCLGVAARLLALDYFDVRDRFHYDSSGYLVIDGEHGDDREYEGRAWNLLSGGNFWALPSGDGSAPPGYPFLIAVLYSMTGRNFLVPLVANALFGGILGLAVYFLASRSLPATHALLAAGGVAVDPLLIFWSTRIMTETIAVLLGVLCLLAVAQTARRTQDFRWAVLCGVLCGLAILVRGNLIVLPLAFIAWPLLTRSVRLWRQTVITTLCTFLVVFTITMIGVERRPSRTESQWERSVSWLVADQSQKIALDKAARKKGGSLTLEERQAVAEAAAVYAQSQPWWTLVAQRFIHNFSMFWQLTPSVGSWVVAVVYVGTTLGLILFGLIGTVSLLRARSTREQATLWLLVIVGLSAMHTILISQPRYRLLLEPLLWIFAVSGGARLLDFTPGRSLKKAA